MPEPELVTAEMYGGVADGRVLQLDPTVEAVVLSGATYRRDGQGVWRFDEPRLVITGDAIVDEAVAIFGRKRLTRLLALVAAEKAGEGHPFFWCVFASRLNGFATEGDEWKGRA